MNNEEAFEALKSDLENQSPAREVFRYLKEGAEIEICISGAIDCVFFQQDKLPHLEKRSAVDPVLSLTLRTESIYVLRSRPGSSFVEFVSALGKEVLAGTVHIQLHRPLAEALAAKAGEFARRGVQGGLLIAQISAAASVSRFKSFIKNLKPE